MYLHVMEHVQQIVLVIVHLPAKTHVVIIAQDAAKGNALRPVQIVALVIVLVVVRQAALQLVREHVLVDAQVDVAVSVKEHVLVVVAQDVVEAVLGVLQPASQVVSMVACEHVPTIVLPVVQVVVIQLAAERA